VKKRLTIGIAAFTVAVTVSLVAAGPYYPRQASERRAAAPRLAADTRMDGDNPVMQVFTPRTSAAPRIIHVPQPRDEEVALPREHYVAPPRERRNALIASPPPAHELSPIYPTPKFGTEDRHAEKFAPPDEAAMPSAEENYRN
jgi:hypothetical protein